MGLLDCTTVSELYDFLGGDEKNIGGFLYGGGIKYREFFIPKKNGGKRQILAPVRKLKNLQLRIKIELEKIYVPRKCVHGFVIEKSVVTNARPHINKEYVLNLDLEDFFGSINFGRVSKLFQSAPMNLNPSVANVLAHICCYHKILPQGAPTSPIISNMIFFRLDNELRKLARKHNCSYTRYADDISFSFTQKRKFLPREVVFFNENDEPVLGGELKKIIERNWFGINYKKVRMQHRTQRQSVTNITVNKKINIENKFIKKTSAMINAVIKYGEAEAEREYFSKYHQGYVSERALMKKSSEPGKLFLQKIRGRLNYIRFVKGEKCNSWRKLMYQYTLAINDPKEIYARSYWDIMSDSTYILYNLSDEECQGSGFYLDGIGLVTNEHVIKGITEDSIGEYLDITWLRNKKKNFIELQLVWKDEEKDLAVINSEISFNDVTALSIEEHPSYDSGEEIYTIGYPNYDQRNTGSATTLKANITGKVYREGQLRIVIDKSIVHGHSGGPVFNENGRVIGIVANGNPEGSCLAPNAFIPISVLVDNLKR